MALTPLPSARPAQSEPGRKRGVIQCERNATNGLVHKKSWMLVLKDLAALSHAAQAVLV